MSLLFFSTLIGMYASSNFLLCSLRIRTICFGIFFLIQARKVMQLVKASAETIEYRKQAVTHHITTTHWPHEFQPKTDCRWRDKNSISLNKLQRFLVEGAISSTTSPMGWCMRTRGTKK